MLRLFAPAIVALVLWAPAASANFPYTGPGGNIHDPTTWKLPPGVAPSNFGDDWKLAATPGASSRQGRTHQSYSLPAGAERYVAIRAVNAVGNIGLPAVIRRA